MQSNPSARRQQPPRAEAGCAFQIPNPVADTFRFGLVRVTGMLLLATAALAACSAEAVQDAPFRPLFDGRTLAGWEGNTAVWRVEDGAIVAGTLEGRIPHNEFLCTTTDFEDFELRLQARLVGPGDNAGIQFRTRRVPGHDYEVAGYQADMGMMSTAVLARMSGREVTDAELENRTRLSPIWGHLYDESRRNRFLDGGEEAEVLAVLRPNEWNDFVIRAEGPHIGIWLNGLQTVSYTEQDESIERAGAICLQIHGGAPSVASYREIVIREL